MDPFTILVVEDNKEYRLLLQNSFEEEGFRVRTATSGPESIESILQEKPDVLILDLALPGMPGQDLCRVIKEDPFLRDIVVIIVSANSDLETKISCLNIGANDYLLKPIETQELIARVRSFLRMVQDLKTGQPPETVQERTVHMPQVLDKEKSFPTVDFVGASASGDQSVRIRPRYGVYRVETLIGSGAMGHVFKAYDEPLERFVAIKILSRKLSNSPAFLERFRREAKVLAALNHPGIAFIYSFGEEEGEHYFAIQWCSGGTLADLIRQKQKIEVLPALEIVIQASRALEAASKKGVVHRDIKPSNILFDENQHVKIVDFGLASAEKMSARITHVEEFLGTPSFMAPEQAQSSSVDHRADIYSLGITFYFMLYGKLPFTASTAIEMVIKHATQPFPSYNPADASVPARAFEIIERMTKKSSEDRYPDYQTLTRDLEQLRNELLSQSHWKIPKAAQVAPVPEMRSDNLFDLMSHIYNSGDSAVMTFRWSSLQKRFLVKQREIVLFESSQLDENVWDAMLQRELMKDSDLPRRNVDLETFLNQSLLAGKFTMESFRMCYRDVMKASIIQVFFWPVFEGEVTKAQIEHDGFVTIRIAELLLEAARTFIDFQRAGKELPREQRIARTATFETVLSTLNLKPEESFIASRIEGQDITLDTLQLLTGLPEENIGRFIYALFKMGALQFQTISERKPVRRLDVSPTPAEFPPRTHEEVEPVPVRVEPQVTPADSAPPPPFSEEKVEQITQPVRVEVKKSDKTIEQEHHIRVAEQFYRLAMEKFELEDYWNSTQLCKQAIKNHPTEAKYYNLIAHAYAHHPRFGKDAEQYFYKALELEPWNPDFHLDLANFYLNHGLSKRAMTQCQKALKISPQHEKARRLYESLSAGA